MIITKNKDREWNCVPANKIEFKAMIIWCRKNFGKTRDPLTAKWYTKTIKSNRCIIIRDKEMAILALFCWSE